MLWIINPEGFTFGERGAIAQALAITTVQLARHTAVAKIPSELVGGRGGLLSRILSSLLNIAVNNGALELRSTKEDADGAYSSSSDKEAALFCAGAAVLGVLFLVATAWMMLLLMSHSLPATAPPPLAATAVCDYEI